MSTTVTSLDAEERKAQETDAEMALIFPKPTEPPKRKAGRPRKIEVVIDDEPETDSVSNDVEVSATAVPDVAYTEKMIWKEAMFVAMTNFQVRSADGIAKCVPIADEFLNIYTERWEK